MTRRRICLTPGRRSLLCGRWWTAVWAAVWTNTWTCCPAWLADWRTAWSEALTVAEAVGNYSCGLMSSLDGRMWSLLSPDCDLVNGMWWFLSILFVYFVQTVNNVIKVTCCLLNDPTGLFLHFWKVLPSSQGHETPWLFLNNLSKHAQKKLGLIWLF